VLYFLHGPDPVILRLYRHRWVLVVLGTFERARRISTSRASALLRLRFTGQISTKPASFIVIPAPQHHPDCHSTVVATGQTALTT
jgi:hypothetical protein